jgi:hypothetical protein
VNKGARANFGFPRFFFHFLNAATMQGEVAAPVLPDGLDQCLF